MISFGVKLRFNPATILLLGVIPASMIYAQPSVLGTQVINGSYTTHDLVLRGNSGYVRLQAASGATAGIRNWEFATGTAASANYNINWRPYISGQTLSGYNNYIDPSAAASSARFNTGSGGSPGLLPAVISNYYYTFITGSNASSDNFMSVLETAYNPTNFTGVSQSPLSANVFPGQTVTVTVNMAATLNANEFVYLRYATVSDFSSSAIATVSMSGNTGSAIIPANTNTAGTTVYYYLFTSNQNMAPAAAQSDYFSLNTFNTAGQNSTGSNFSYTVKTGWITTNNGSWSSASTWTANAVPSSSISLGTVTIAHNVTMDQDATVSSIFINNTATLSATAFTLTVSNNNSGANFTNNGSYNASGTHTVNFSGGATHTVAGTVSFNNVTIAGGLNFGTASTIQGTFTINNGGFISTNSPKYGTGSVLFYNTASYVRGLEWIVATTSPSQAGYPNNVTIGSSLQACSFSANNSGPLQIGGSLTIGASAGATSSFTLNENATPNTLTVVGNITINTTGTFTLGSLAAGNAGDLKAGGNFVNSGIFNANNRAVNFNGITAQTISGTGLVFPYATISNTSATGVACNASATFGTAGSLNSFIINAGSVFTQTSGVLTIPGIGSIITALINGTLVYSSTNAASYGGTTSVSLGSGASYVHNSTAAISTQIDKILFNSNSMMIFKGSNSLNANTAFSGKTFGHLKFESVSGNWNLNIGNFGTACSVNDFIIGTNVNLNFPSSFTSGGPYNVNGNVVTDGTITINSGANPSFNLSGSSKTISGSSNTNFYNLNIIGSYTLSNNSPNIVPGGNCNVSGTVNFGATNVISGAGSFSGSGGATLITANTAGLNISGTTGSVQVSGTRTFSNSINYIYNGTSMQFTGTAPGASSYTGNLTVNNAYGVTLSASIILSGSSALFLTSGILDLSSYNLILSTGAVISGGFNATVYIKTSGTGQLKQTVTGVPVTFPVGNSFYNPITLINTGTADIYGINVLDGAVPFVTDATYTVSCAWKISENTPGGGNVSAIAQYNNSNGSGINFNTGAGVVLALYIPSLWTTVNATHAGANPYTVSGQTGFTNTISGNCYLAIGNAIAFGPSITSFTPVSGYTGTQVIISGKNFTGATLVAIGGVSAHSFIIVNDNQINAVVGANASNGSISVTTANGQVSQSGFTYLGYITQTGAGDWSNTNSWLGAISVPVSGADVTIDHHLILQNDIVNKPNSIVVNSGIVFTIISGSVASASSITNYGSIIFSGTGSISTSTFTNNAGSTLSWSAPGTLNISSAGTFTNHGTFTGGTGKVNFIGPATINGTNIIKFNDITINSGNITIPTGTMIDGVFTINGGNLNSFGPSPIYTSNSTLVYNTSYSRSFEWNSTGVGVIGSTAGYPNNVTINTGTFNLLNGTDAAIPRAIAGTLIINAGATFASGAKSASLTIGGDIYNNGTLTMANTTAGADLNVGGNFTNNGAFIHNDRPLGFIGIKGNQIFSGVSSITYLNINNTSASNPNVILGNALTINSGGTLWLTSGHLILGVHDLSMSASATLNGGSPTAFIAAESTGNLIWNFAANTNYTSRNYPLGVMNPGIVYTPIIFTNFSNSGSAGTFGLKTVSAVDPNMSNPSMPASYITRYWMPTITGLNSYSIGNTSIRYSSASEVVGSEASVQLAVWNNSVQGWQSFGGIATGGQLVTSSSLTNTAFATGNNITAREHTQLYYRSAVTGPSDWSIASSWETSNNAGFSAVNIATIPPNYLNALNIYIRTGHTIYTTANVNTSALSVDGTLNLNGGVFNLLSRGGTDMIIGVTGRLNLNNPVSNSINFNTGTASVVNGYMYNSVLSPATNYNGTFTFNDGSTFENAANGGTVPYATWNGGVTGSTVYFTGNTTNGPGNLGQAFYHFKWNCNQSQVVGLGLGSLIPAMSVKGDLVIQNTGNSELRLFSQTAGGSLNVSGNAYIQGGILAIFGGGTYSVNRTVNVYISKNLNLSGSGKLNLTSNSAGLSGTHNSNVYLGGNLDVTGLAQILQPLTTNVISNFVFNNSSSVQTYSSTNSNALSSAFISWCVGDISGAGANTNTLKLNSHFITQNSLSAFRVYNKATIQCTGEIILGGAGAGFNLYPGAGIQIGSVNGISSAGASGNIQTSGTRSFDNGANYYYIGAANQNTGNGLPTTITGSLSISNTGSYGNNIVTLTTNNTETKSLFLNSGLFAAGTGQTLKISNTGFIDASGGGSCVTTAPGGNIWLTGNNTVTGTGSGTPSFYDLTIGNGIPASPVSLISNPSVYHSCTLNSEASFNGTSAPTYINGSTLIYNTGGIYNRNIEWGSASGNPGYPWHVKVQNSTTLNAGVVIPTALELGGDLIIGTSTSGNNVVNMNSLMQPLKIGGNLIIGDNATAGNELILSSSPGGDLELSGNFTRYNANNYFKYGTRTVFFKGSSNATINAGIQKFYNISLQKTGSGDITINCPVIVENNAAFGQGKINTTLSNILSFEQEASVSGAPGPASYINGPAAKEYNSEGSEFTFPIGKATASPAYNPCGLVPVSIPAFTRFQAEYFPGPEEEKGLMGGSLLGIQGSGYWDIGNSNPGNSSARVKLNYNNPGLGNWIYYNAESVSPYYEMAPDPCLVCNVAVIHRDKTTTAWSFTSAPGFSSSLPEYRFYRNSGFIYSGVISDFSPFSIGFSYNVILPVKLVSFSGSLQFNDGKLSWNVANMGELKSFELQYSRDGQNFSKLAEITENGNETYSYLHQHVNPGINYYRLRVNSKNGSSFYSQVVALTTGSLITQIIGLKNNPVINEINALILSSSVQRVKATINDASGRTIGVYSNTVTPGLNQWPISASNLPLPGIYFLSIHTADGEHAAFKFIKQ